jgi:hypothetical protein
LVLLNRTLGTTTACRVAATAGTALVVAINERRDKGLLGMPGSIH